MTVKSIDTKQFDTTISALSTAVAAFENSKKNAESATDSLLATWKGKGRATFEGVYNKLKTEMEDDLENLKTLKDDLTNMKQAYVDWDSGIASELKPEATTCPSSNPDTGPLGIGASVISGVGSGGSGGDGGR